MAGSHCGVGKAGMYEESVRVPLFLRFPNCTSRQVKKPVCTMDLFATVLDAAGVDSETLDQPLYGQSLLAEDLELRDVFIEYKQDCLITD